MAKKYMKRWSASLINKLIKIKTKQYRKPIARTWNEFLLTQAKEDETCLYYDLVMLGFMKQTTLIHLIEVRKVC